MRFPGLIFRLAATATSLAMLTSCAPAWLSPVEHDHPLTGRIWDTQAQRPLDEEALLRRASRARIVILGETHDNSDHHRLQATILAGMLRTGRSPALAMEQFDREHQPSLDAARLGRALDAEEIADAGKFDRKGWHWPDYEPLVRLAVEHGLPIIAANLSREDARALMKSAAAGARLASRVPPIDPPTRAALERDIVEGHCGMPMSPALLAGMVAAQSARDSLLAQSVQSSGEGGAVLITGALHARRDRGAPLYLSASARESLLVIAFVEVEAGLADPRRYASAAEYDLIWFTPRAERADPCESFRPKVR